MKRFWLKKMTMLLMMGLIVVFFSGFSSVTRVQDFKDALSPETSFSLPKDTYIVGVGEATHGNKEFVQIKQEVFQYLVRNYGYRVFALEGDFGGCQVVNEYVVNGKGTAEDAVKQIGFAIYKTQEMVDLVKWIHDYNVSLPAGSKIHFYGFDMQRYDNNKKGLLAYFYKVGSDKLKPYEKSLSALNDKAMYDLTPEKVLSGQKAIQSIMKEMEQNKKKYVAKSSEAEFSLAFEYANSIQQNTVLRGEAGNYSQVRDEFMAVKVSWILSHENRYGGRDKLMISGHNGHIEKSSASSSFKSMGNILAENYKDQYFAIGTEFYESTFNSKDSSTGQRKTFYLKNDQSNQLATLFKETEWKTGYIDLNTAIGNPELNKIFTSSQRMTNIGDEFSSMHATSTAFYTLSMVPVKAYDSIIFVRTATPITMLQ